MYYDPSRQKNVAATPEEQVRQTLVHWLTSECAVPMHLLETEFSLSRVRPGAKGRVDVLVHDFRSGANMLSPWLLAECKRPGEYDWSALEVQVARYLKVLSPRYVLVGIGDDWRLLEQKEKGSYAPLAKLPKYPSIA